MIDNIGLNDKLTIQVVRDGTVEEMTPTFGYRNRWQT